MAEMVLTALTLQATWHNLLANASANLSKSRLSLSQTSAPIASQTLPAGKTSRHTREEYCKVLRQRALQEQEEKLEDELEEVLLGQKKVRRVQAFFLATQALS